VEHTQQLQEQQVATPKMKKMGVFYTGIHIHNNRA
jgi:hypothetical protein